MIEDSRVRVSSSDEVSVANDASQTRQRKKRKWDQPAKLLVSVGMEVPDALPNVVSFGGVAFPGMAPKISAALLVNPLAASTQLQQHTTATTAVAAQKLNQDQYIKHIINKTGATVVLRGRGSGKNECLNGEDGQQPLHLFLSSNNAKSLEDAKFLAENLLDTICTECGASRVHLYCKIINFAGLHGCQLIHPLIMLVQLKIILHLHLKTRQHKQ